MAEWEAAHFILLAPLTSTFRAITLYKQVYAVAVRTAHGNQRVVVQLFTLLCKRERWREGWVWRTFWILFFPNSALVNNAKYSVNNSYRVVQARGFGRWLYTYVGPVYSLCECCFEGCNGAPKFVR